MNKTGKGVAIREAGLQDAAAIKMCIDRAYAPVKARLADRPDVSAGIEDDILSHTVFVAETDGRITGCAILGITGKSAHLVNIAVDPDHGGNGIGKALIRKVEDSARQRGAMEIHLATHIGMPENVMLYVRLGRKETSRNGNKVLMKKEILP